MLYQDYQAKLAKRKRAFERFWHLRLLFLAILLLLLAGAFAMLGVAGQVTGYSAPSVIAYGESLGASSEAVFGREFGFEYRRLGTEEWTTEEPRAAGTYECRALGKSVFGTRRRGEIFTYTVEPVKAEVRVSSGELIYGESPSFSAQLCYNDTLIVDDYFAERVSSTQLKVEANVEKVRVVNEAGEDVTSSYAFTASSRTITDVARRITVRTGSSSFVYDGVPHSDTGLTFEGLGLAAGDVADAAFPEITDVGVLPNQPTGGLHIRNAAGEDVTDRYQVTFAYGKVEVTKRPITVVRQGGSFVYDGTAHEFPASDYSIEQNPLVAGHTVELDSLSVKEADTYFFPRAVTIYSGEEDVTGNYEITRDFGTVEVRQRPITVVRDTEEFVYDGTEHAFDYFTTPVGPAEGHNVTVDPVGFTEANEDGYPIGANTVHIFDGDEDVTKNYSITAEFGKIFVRRRPVTLHTDSEEFVYDGQTHIYGADKIEDISSEENSGLAANHSINGTRSRSYTDANPEGYSNDPEYTIVDGSGNNVTKNYLVTTEFGTIVILKRKITVTYKSDEWVYDGILHTFGEGEGDVQFERDPWFDEHSGEGEDGDKYSGEGAIAQGQLYELVPDETHRNAFQDVGSYKNAPHIRIFNASGDYTVNYEITYIEGDIKIEKRSVTVTFDSGSLVYNGSEQAIETFTAEYQEDYPAIDGHEIRIVYLKDGRKNVGNYSNTGDISIWAGSVDVTENYDIKPIEGTLEITEFEVAVRALDRSFEYDGTPKNYLFANPERPLPEGHTVRVVKGPEWTDAAVYTDENVFELDDIKIFVGEEDVTSNFTILSCKEGTVTIERRKVTIGTDTDSFIYDAQSHVVHSYHLLENTLAEGHELVFSSPERTDVGETVNEFTAVDILADGVSVLKNYELTYVNGTITVNQRPITIQTNSDGKVYDATELYNALFEDVGEYHVVEGQEFVVNHSTHITNVWETYEGNNVFDDYDILAGEQSVLANYDVTLINGTLTINKRPVTIQAKSAEKIYDGEDFFFAEFDDVGEEYGIVEGQKFVVNHSTHITNVWETSEGNNVFDEYDILAGGESVLDNYEVTLLNGTLTINLRPITIQAKSDTKTYDGEDFFFAEFDDVGEYHVVDGQMFVVKHSTHITNVRETHEGNNEFDDYDILAGETSVLANYDVTLKNGTLTIEKRPVTIRAGSDTKTYDAQEFFCTEYIDVGEDLYLVEGHKFTAQTYTRITNVSESGDNVFGEDFLLQDENGEDVKGNYRVTLKNGTLTINKREVTIRTGTDEKVYDATELYNALFEDVGVYHVVEGQEFVVKHSTHIVNVRETREGNNEFDDYDILAGETSVLDNYDVTFENGTLTITQRPFYVTTHSNSFVYDDRDHFDDGYDFEPETKDRGILALHEASATVSIPTLVRFVKDSGKGNNELTLSDIKIVVKGGDEDVTDNYIYMPDENVLGDLTVNPRPVTIQTGDAEKTYDGEELFCETFEDVGEEYKIVEGHEFVVGTTTHITDVKDSGANVFSPDFTIRRKGETENLKDNYTVTFQNGTLTINKREVTIRTGTNEKVYDATALYSVEYFEDVGEVHLVEGHTLIPQTYTRVTNVAEKVPNVFEEDYLLQDRNGKDVKDNYIVEFEHGTLTVTRLTINIKSHSSEHVYDGKWQYDDTFEEGMGEELLKDKAQHFVFDHSRWKVPGTYDNIFTDIKVMQGDDDMTANYTIETEWGTVEITKRKISLASDSGTFGYDGNGHTVGWTAWTKGQLAEGHTFQEGVFQPFKDAGEHENTFDRSNVRILDENEEDVTDCYKFMDDDTYGTVTILAHMFKISSKDSEHVYDGESHNGMHGEDWKEGIDYTVETGGDFPEGYTYEIKVTGADTLLDVGGKPNKLTYEVHIYDKERNEVTENFDIDDETFGWFTITPRTAYVVTQSNSWTYDGEPHTFAEFGEGKGFTIEGLVEGQTVISASATGSIGYVTNVSDGEVPNTFTVDPSDVVIHDAESNVIPSGNYTFVIEKDGTGTLTITPRVLCVQPDGKTFEYNGEDQSCLTFTLSEPKENEGLLHGHTLEVLTATAVRNFVDSGKENQILTYRILENGTVDRTANYELIQENKGTLTVTPLTINIKSHSSEHVYDGMMYHDDTFEEDMGEELLKDKAQHFVFEYLEWKVPGTYDNIFTDIKVMQGNVDMTANYTIETEWGTVEITKRKISLESDSTTEGYDGSGHSAGWTQGTKDQLASGDKIEEEDVFRNFQDAGEHENKFDREDVHIYDGDGNDVTDYYEFDGEDKFGTVTVTEHTITISSTDSEHEYDGESHNGMHGEKWEEGVDYTVDTGDEFPEGYTYEITVKEAAERTDVGDTPNTLTYEVHIYDQERNDVTKNFLIDDEKYGKLTITPRTAYVVTQSNSWTYDGEPHTFAEFGEKKGFTIEGLVKGQTVISARAVEDSMSFLTHVWESGVRNTLTVDPEDVDIRDAAGKEISSYNYRFETQAQGTLTITKRPITVTSGDAEKVYDGEHIGSNECTPVYPELYPELIGHTVEFESNISVVDVGEHPNTGKVTIYFNRNAEGEMDVTRDFEITLQEGTITITPRPFTYETGSQTWISDGAWTFQGRAGWVQGLGSWHS